MIEWGHLPSLHKFEELGSSVNNLDRVSLAEWVWEKMDNRRTASFLTHFWQIFHWFKEQYIGFNCRSIG